MSKRVYQHIINCPCGYHESGHNNNGIVSETLMESRFSEWKKEVEDSTTFGVPSVAKTLCIYSHLYNFRQLFQIEILYSRLVVWSNHLVENRIRFYGECVFAFSLSLRRIAPFNQNRDLRRLLLKAYLEETGILRFKRWLTFILSGMRIQALEEKEGLKKIKYTP